MCDGIVMGRKLVITGALGHIGSRLIRSGAVAGFEEILLIDNLLTHRYGSLFDLPSAPSFRFVEANILKADLAGLFRDAYAVIHLAAITDATSSLQNPVVTEEVNYQGTARVANAAAAVGARLLFVSTTSVYGTQADVVDENTPIDALQPQSPYAASKLKAETLLRSMSARETVRATTCRFGTIYGTSPGMRFHTAINKFCWQAVLRQPITVWKTALDQVRPYLDLGDACRAIGHILEHDLFAGELFNALTDNCTVRQILEIIQTHVPIAMTMVDSAIMNQLSYHVSNAKFGATGFVPRGSLREGIAATIGLLRNMNGVA
jgi:UDP-glucose 4-epimerase